MVPPLKNKITPTTSRLSIGGHQEQRPHGESFYEKARGTNLQWRARERPQSQPKTPQGNTRSPPASEAPLSRNLYNYDFPPRPTIPTTEEVLAELQDVTIQYINCADPTESAARRLRVTQGEQQNLMANTVAGIIEAATATANFIAGAPQNTAGPTIILPDPRAVTQDTVLVDSSCSHPVASAPSKRRGRPPGTKKMAASPKNLLGASSRKHNFARIQSSLAKNCDVASSSLPPPPRSRKDEDPKDTGSSFYCTFVYGAPEVANRKGVWNALSDLSTSRTGAWFLTGDFNEIIN
ncbi:unnamed protein product, partial [Brassica napus]